jgi:soluble lytic murein transglycosylase
LAQAIYQALPQTLDAHEDAAARLGLAQSLLEDDAYVEAADAARAFLSQYPDHPQAAEAHFWLAEALVGSGEYQAAAAAYSAYLERRDVIAPYVHTWIGDVYTYDGDYDQAASAYLQALDQSPSLDRTLLVREKLGLAYNYAGDHAAALAQYDAILASASDANLRARIQYQAAQTLLVAGEREAAYTRLYDLVTNYYKTASAYNALVDLIDSGQPVNEYQRGVVDYYNGAYDPAVAAFYRAIEADPAGHDGVLHYFAGLAYRDAGNYGAALDEFEVLINTHPGDIYVDDAWLARAWVQYLIDDDDAAVQTYTDFVANYPASSLAPEALWWAGNIRLWAGAYEGAEPLFTQLAADYPANEYAPTALYRAALCRYLVGDYEQAVGAWQGYSDDYPAAELAAGAHFWRGRAYLDAGQTLSATQAFSQSVAAGPLDYYSQRALDYLADLEQPRPPFVYQPFDPSLAEPDQEAEHAANVWLAGELGLDARQAITLSQLSPALAADPRLLRGQELWRLGRRDEAKEELEWLRYDNATDLLHQYQLAVFFQELGLYRSSIIAANAAISLSSAHSIFDAPPFLARLAYPAHYADLVLYEAQANDLDPLLLFSLIRQESLFEGFATSYAYAHGLMQVIPSTGRSIANSLGWPDYETSDLYRPFVSVKFGSWYLAQQLGSFGIPHVALSAYNAGPGNAMRWLNRVLDACPAGTAPEECAFDYDLFVEIIHLRETRLYVRQIYKHFAAYQYLYGLP